MELWCSFSVGVRLSQSERKCELEKLNLGTPFGIFGGPEGPMLVFYSKRVESDDPEVMWSRRCAL